MIRASSHSQVSAEAPRALVEALRRPTAGASVPSAVSHSGRGNGSAPAGAEPELSRPQAPAAHKQCPPGNWRRPSSTGFSEGRSGRELSDVRGCQRPLPLRREHVRRLRVGAMDLPQGAQLRPTERVRGGVRWLAPGPSQPVSAWSWCVRERRDVSQRGSYCTPSDENDEGSTSIPFLVAYQGTAQDAPRGRIPMTEGAGCCFCPSSRKTNTSTASMSMAPPAPHMMIPPHA